jgi:FkbM family methyltransferase
MPLARGPRVVLDLGGNIGAATVYFATRWPEAQIAVIEPDPDAFQRLLRNTSRFAGVRALRVAVAEAEGQAQLYRSGYTLTSSLVGEAGHREAIPVPHGHPGRPGGASVAEFARLFPMHRVEIDRLPNGEHLFRAWL